VYYGRAHALQGVSLALDHGVLAVVGRNGMGKTTLCNAVTGLVRATGSVKLAAEEILGLPANVITTKGVGYVPQGRRVWPSLSVDEHLRLARRKGPWTVERIYQTFPRLAERKANGGAELSGGEQQMLAISRALLANPKLLVMDEPTEGLAPIIVQQVVAMLKTLAAEGEISVLLVEQNLGVAIDVADTVDVMVNGRIARSMTAAELGADRDLQQRLLGVKLDADITPDTAVEDEPPQSVQVLTVKRANDAVVAEPLAPQEQRTIRGFTRWGSTGRDHVVGADGPRETATPEPRVVELPVAQTVGRAAYIAGTFDTKGRELFYLRA
jgi:ABC-type branched-subunit amino acid transport system ATPase component